jgi:hypothetical protein
MDFLDPKRKRAYNIRLAVGFVLITVALILGTTILALITAGYGFNTKTGQVFQNGLVFINAQPTSASIYENGHPAGTTNARLELPAGNYNFVLKQAGYHDWSNNLTLFGGSVQQLNYPFLFPTKPIAKSVLTMSSAPQIATETPNRHWLLVTIPGQTEQFNVIDATNIKTPQTTVTIPSSLLNNQPGTNNFKVVQWSTDNQHVILEDDFDGGSSFIMFDWADPTTSVNLTQQFSTTTISSVRMQNNNFDTLYIYNANDKSLNLAKISDNSVTPVLTNVLAYWPYATNQIVYTTPDAKDSDAALAMLWSSGKSNELRSLPSGSSYQLNIATYSGHSYVIVGSSGSDYAYIYEDPLTQISNQPGTMPLPTTLLVSSGTPQNVTFSNSARFIALQSGSQFAVYDLETQTHYRYDTGYPLSPNEVGNWMDGNRLTFISGGQLVVFDFDGTNKVTFTPSGNDYLPAFSQSYDSVYTVTPTPGSPTGQFEVLRTSLIANKF